MDFWWEPYGAFAPSAEIPGYPDPHEVFMAYYRRSGMSRRRLAQSLRIQEKMVYHLERSGRSLHSIARLRQLCAHLQIPAILFGLAECPEKACSWQVEGYGWPAGDDGFPAPGPVVQFFRRYLEWRQRDLANALGLSVVTVRQMERANRNMDTVLRRQKIACVLTIPTEARVWLGLDALHSPR